MKHLVRLVLPLLLVLMIGGCGKNNSLTEEQNDLIAEYAANEVLQNDPEYKDRLITSSASSADAEATTQVEATTQASATTASTTDDTTQAQVTTEDKKPAISIVDLFQNLGVTVTYKGYNVCDSYNDTNESSSAVYAPNGGKLLIAKFDVSNTTKKSINLDMLAQNYKYTLQTSTGTTESLLTFLNTDFSVYQNRLDAGVKKKVVILFEIPKECQEPFNYTLTINNGDNNCEIAIP